MKIGFDNDKYLQLQSEHIKERISRFGDKLYLEFGGKLYDDYHASRVLPGFKPDSKLSMLLQLKEDAEIIISISARAIASNKQRADLGITYDEDVFRLIDIFKSFGLYVSSVAITRYTGESAVSDFRNSLAEIGIKTYILNNIDGYPSNIDFIVSEDGYGKNDYIKTTRPLVIVTAPGPGSGKMATCLSQLYHEHKHGINAGYAKFETFPVWNLPLTHPVNIAYEAATADLNDVNMIDPFHLEAYGETCINYNRDVEIYPVLKVMFERIFGECPYKSPTDMGVNMVGNCISDDEVCRDAARTEIIRRFYNESCNIKKKRGSKEARYKIELLMKQADISPDSLEVVKTARNIEAETHMPAVAIDLGDIVVDGKTSDLLSPSASALLNALKELAGVDHDKLLISRTALAPIQELKKNYLGINHPRINSDEVLIALSISSNEDENAKKAFDSIKMLKGLTVHSSVMLDEVDEGVFKRLGMYLTCEPKQGIKS